MGCPGQIRGYYFIVRSLVTAASLALIACGNAPGTDSDESVSTSSSQALTAAQSRVLGFEAPTQDWRTSNSVALGSSSIVSQGAAALSVVPNGYIELFSSTMRAPGGALSTATVDVRLSKTQTSGDVHLVMQSPSAGLSWSDFGVVSLVGRPANSYQTLSFTVPAAAKTVLNGNANDINFRLVFNVGGNSGTFLVDNL